MDNNVMFKLSYGLFVLSSKAREKQSGCIVNTVMQQTVEPNRISVTVNKNNFTADIIKESGKFTVSVIDESAEFSIFEKFGFKSGRDCDKFADVDDKAVDENGIYYLTKSVNSFLSANVVETKDLGTHIMFIADVVGGEVLSDNASMTYDYYFANVKPKPEKTESKSKSWVCKICGWVYDEEKTGIPFEELPDDWVCPLCKHPKSDFELI